MSNFYLAHERNQLFRRLERVTADTLTDDGLVSGHHTVLHLARELEAVLAAGDHSPQGNAWSRSVGRLWVLNVAPWPEKLPRTAAEVEAFAPTLIADAFNQDFNTLIERIRHFDARAGAGSLGPHHRFGRLSRDDWGKYLYLHVDWHLSKLKL